MKKLAKKLLLLFISIQFVACEGSLEPHLYGVVDYWKCSLILLQTFRLQRLALLL